MLNYFKNFIITFLVVLAVYQTNKLWFEDFSSHNFFYTVFRDNLSQGSAGEIKNELEYIAVNNGSNRFVLYRDNADIDGIKQNLIKLAETAVIKSEPQIYDSFDLGEMLSGRSAVLHYGFMLSGDIFSAMYDTDSNKRIPEFDSIAIKDMGADGFKVLFFGSDSSEGALYELESYSGSGDIKNIVDSARQSVEEVYYVSSVLSGYDVFRGNEFIPTWAGEAYYGSIISTNPVSESDSVSAAGIDSFVNGYFENPVLKWTSMDDNVYIFSDESTVVKYYPEGVMEYASYSGQNGGTDFETGLAAAESFLEYEPTLKNDYYLAGFDYDADRIIYYFDYKINNLPLRLSEPMKEKLGMKSFIEVTVDGRRISKYKRYLKDYSNTVKDPIYTRKSFLEAIDNGLSVLKGEKINSLSLSYLETGDENIPLCYVANIDGRYYSEAAY